jgi:hypothetical protein
MQSVYPYAICMYPYAICIYMQHASTISMYPYAKCTYSYAACRYNMYISVCHTHTHTHTHTHQHTHTHTHTHMQYVCIHCSMQAIHTQTFPQRSRPLTRHTRRMLLPIHLRATRDACSCLYIYAPHATHALFACGLAAASARHKRRMLLSIHLRATRDACSCLCIYTRVRILLHPRPRTTTYVSSYSSYICVDRNATSHTLCVKICVAQASIDTRTDTSPTTVRIRQHTSAYVNIRRHTSAYVSIRQHTQHTSAYVSMPDH